MGWEGGGAVWVGWFYQWVLPHLATGHGGRLDVRADRRHPRRPSVLTGLSLRGQLYMERHKEVFLFLKTK